ncbi:uncharacterized protein MYCGRDRAFT_95554 [Zymoseptoria tritici IPO323]|uniref:Uncharacterized protein n=1 Tax=Zymoseptoria tritici (strain CBS 115943 / IPO323) TaxID=336722 RepID=F9XJ23_ZYMTI|nr:uncharacterized protein MYCGRDRAFT_95554 [Zymoseptoria tritici IPO323]EGP84275.1 hypothetical protein MYCGRDRAFT_95554 [Zymoseptoria tritici IPO323]
MLDEQENERTEQTEYHRVNHGVNRGLESGSMLCGWGYFTLWSLSYYPQPLLNFSQKSTEGLTFDYPVLNVLGSACYFWPGLWRWRSTCVASDRTGKREMSKVTAALVVGCGLAVVTSIAFALVPSGLAMENAADGITWEWIDVISTISTLKLVITVFKYAPQILSNHRRRSARGFTIIGVLLDAGGGILSLVQLVVDCSQQAD